MRTFVVVLILGCSVAAVRGTEPAPPPRPVAPPAEVAPLPRELPDEPPLPGSGLDASVLPPLVPPPVEIRITPRGVEYGPEKRNSEAASVPPVPAELPNPQREKAERELPWMIAFGGFVALLVVVRVVFGRSKPPAAKP